MLCIRFCSVMIPTRRPLSTTGSTVTPCDVNLRKAEASVSPAWQTEKTRFITDCT